MSNARRVAAGVLLAGGLLAPSTAAWAAPVVPTPGPAPTVQPDAGRRPPTTPTPPAGDVPPAAPGRGQAGTVQPARPGPADLADAAAATPNAPVGGLANLCVRPPEPEAPNENLPGLLDQWTPGDTPPPGDTRYARYGFAGYGVVAFDPGCATKLVLSNWAPPGASMAINATLDLSTLLNMFTATIIAFVVWLARFVFSADGLVGIFDMPLTLIRSQMGILLLTLFGAVGVAGTAVMVAWRDREGDVHRAAKEGGGALGVVGLGLFCVMIQVGLGPILTASAGFVLSSVSATTAGSADYSRDVGDAIADPLVDHVLYQSWLYEHFGTHQVTANDPAHRFGERLHAASAFSRQEINERLTADGKVDANALRDLAKSKRDDFTTVARELQATDPAAYQQLAGVQPLWKPMWALLGAVIGWVAVAPLVITVGVVGATCLFILAAMTFLAVAAVVLQFPAMQHFVPRLLTYAGGLMVLAFVCVVAMVAYVTVGLGAVLAGQTEYLHRAVVAVVLGGSQMWAWRHRSKILNAFGVSSAEKQARMTGRAVASSLTRTAGFAAGFVPGGKAAAVGLYAAASKMAPKRAPGSAPGHGPEAPADATITSLLPATYPTTTGTRPHEVTDARARLAAIEASKRRADVAGQAPVRPESVDPVVVTPEKMAAAATDPRIYRPLPLAGEVTARQDTLPTPQPVAVYGPAWPMPGRPDSAAASTPASKETTR